MADGSTRAPQNAIPVYTGFAPSADFGDVTSAAITFNTSGDNIVVAAVAGKQIACYRLYFVVGGATNITIKDGAGTSLTGAMPFATNGSFILDMNSFPWFLTTAGNALIINSSAAVQVSGALTYQEV